MSRFLRLLRGKLEDDLEELNLLKPTRSASSDKLSGHVVKDVYYWEPKSLRIRTINWSHVFLAEYLPYAYILAIATVVVLMTSRLLFTRFEDLTRAMALVQEPLVLQVIGIVALIISYANRMKSPVYCVDNIVFAPPAEWQVSRDEIVNMVKAQGCFTDSSIDFQKRLLDNSGTGESTHWPPGILISKDGTTESQCHMEAAREEAKEVVFSLVQDLLTRTQVKPSAIDFLIINCSLFCPTPSLCALVCNKFGLRQDVRSYNLGGMGCSANVISVDLAKQLLENQPGSRALVISTENITQNLYKGNEKSMLLQNTLFRCGGCALLLSSRIADGLRAKYKLLYTFRAQVSDDNSYQCVYQKEDENGNSGVALSKDIVNVAGRAMRQNFVMLAPYVLPIREQAKVICNQMKMRLVSHAKKQNWPVIQNWSVPKGYTPNFSAGIEHFCIHAGGRAVIEGVQKNLGLSDRQIKPSFQTLQEWGNTSSSSIWYETDWVERFGEITPGERVLQISFGSGFKCNSAVWVALHVDYSKQGIPLKQPRYQCADANGKSRARIDSESNGHSTSTNGCSDASKKAQ